MDFDAISYYEVFCQISRFFGALIIRNALTEDESKETCTRDFTIYDGDVDENVTSEYNFALS